MVPVFCVVLYVSTFIWWRVRVESLTVNIRVTCTYIAESGYKTASREAYTLYRRPQTADIAVLSFIRLSVCWRVREPRCSRTERCAVQKKVGLTRLLALGAGHRNLTGHNRRVRPCARFMPSRVIEITNRRQLAAEKRSSEVAT